MHSLHLIIDLCDVPTRLRFVSVFATQLACLLLLRVLRKYSAPSSELASCPDKMLRFFPMTYRCAEFGLSLELGILGYKIVQGKTNLVFFTVQNTGCSHIKILLLISHARSHSIIFSCLFSMYMREVVVIQITPKEKRLGGRISLKEDGTS